MNLYNLMIAFGLFVATIGFMVEPPRGRLLAFAIAAALFLIAGLTAAGVIHA